MKKRLVVHNYLPAKRVCDAETISDLRHELSYWTEELRELAALPNSSDNAKQMQEARRQIRLLEMKISRLGLRRSLDLSAKRTGDATWSALVNTRGANGVYESFTTKTEADSEEEAKRKIVADLKRSRGATVTSFIWVRQQRAGARDMHPDEIKERIAEVQREMYKIARSGGQVPMNDPLMAKLRGLKAELARERSRERSANDAGRAVPRDEEERNREAAYRKTGISRV